MKNILTRLPRLLLLLGAVLFAGSAWAQMIVTGTVKDNMGPLESVNIKCEQNGKTTVTDFDGIYKISVPDGTASLTFSFQGKATKTISVNNRTTIDVVMAEGGEVSELKGVTVVAYAKLKDSKNPAATVKVRGEDLADRPTIGVDKAMQGKVAGVTVTTGSGRPGGSINVTIRGQGTIGNSKPLYVVDGVPVGEDISHINPGDIENISVLKDPASAAMYGARGANGVVLVSLKQGKKGAAGTCENSQLTFDAFWGIQQAWNTIDVLNAEEYVKVNSEYMKSTTFAGKLKVLNENKAQYGYVSLTGEGTNWQDEIFRNALMHKYQMSLTGATAKTQYAFSGSYMNQEGIVKKTKYERVTVSGKLSNKIFESDWNVLKSITLSKSIGFDMNWEDKVDEGDINTNLLSQALMMDPTVPVQHAIYGDDPEQVRREGWSVGYFGTHAKNPVRMLDVTNNSSKKIGLGGNVLADVELIDNLSVKSQFGYSYWRPTDIIFTPKFYVSSNNQNETARLVVTNHYGNNWTWSNYANYEYNIKSKKDSLIDAHSFNLTAGIESYYEFQEDNLFQGDGYENESDYARYLSSADKLSAKVEDWQRPRESSLYSQFARLNYSLYERYILMANIRRDGSSRLAADKRWGVFPSLSAAWRISQEQFFKKQEFLKMVSDLKLRTTWGQLGNVNSLSEYPSASALFTDYRDYVFGGSVVKGSTVGKLPNPELIWETQEQWGVGLDLSLLKDKITVSLDYFNKLTKDLIVDIPLPAVAGAEVSGLTSSLPMMLANSGNVLNKGVELSLTYSSKKEKDMFFTYDVTGSFAAIKNTVTELGNENGIVGGSIQVEGSTITPSKTMKGHSIAEFYGAVVEGIFQTQEEISTSAQPSAKPGDLKFKDLNGDNKITQADYTFLGSPHPDFTYGLNFDARLLKSQSLDVSLSIQGTQGNSVFNGTKMFLDGSSTKNMSTRRLDGWREDNTGSEEVGYNGSTWTEHAHSLYVEDASYLRLRDVIIGYTLPKALTDKAKIARLRVYLQGSNLLTITNYSGFDPEVGKNEKDFSNSIEFGVDRGTYPQAKAYIFGVNMKF